MRAPSVLALAAGLVLSVTAFAADPPVRPARVLGRHVEAGYETLVVSVDPGTCADPWNRGWQVRLDGAPGEPQPWSGVVTQVRRDPVPAPAHSLTLVVRRLALPPDSPAKPPALLHVYAPARCGSSPEPATGQHLRFTLPETSGLPDDPQAFSTYLIELGQKLRFGSPFGAFAQARLHALAEERFKATAPSPPARPSRQVLRKLGVVGFGHRDVGTAPARPTHSVPRRTPADLARLMSATADATSLQEMLQQDRRLAALTADESAPIPIEKLAGPTLVARPWRELLAGLARPVPTEPLADATPADFYYARFAGLSQLYRLLDGLDGWLSRATTLAGSVAAGAGFADATPIERALAARYLTELGLPPGARAAALMAAISGEVAVVGSDPYLREGSDVTLIWRARASADRVPAAPAPDADRALAAALADLGAGHGGSSADETEEGGVAVRVVRSADGAIHQYRASARGFELCSNSAGAVRRVLAAISGHAPSLGDQLGFRYMLARDGAAPADLLLFAGDRFVAHLVGAPVQIIEARRQLALGELETPGLAALLFGWMNGRAPASADELVASGLLSREELAHGGHGELLSWKPGMAARSSWGTPAALTPLIDFAPPAMVTATERDAYRIFVEGHERDWREDVGPFVLRIAWRSQRQGDSGPVDVDLRLAPFVGDGSSACAALARVVGDARLASSRSAAGLRAAIGFGTAGAPRRWLRQLLAPWLADRAPPSDWLGDWAMAGVDESPASAQANLARAGRTRLFDLVDVLGVGSDGAGRPLDLPIYAGVAVRDEAAAELLLRNARASLGPAAITWRSGGLYRGTAVTRLERESPGPAGARVPSFRPLYFAVCRSTLLVALGEETLHHRIDDCLDGRLPRLEAKLKVKRAEAASAAARGDSLPGAQLVVDVDLPPGGTLWSIAGGLAERLAVPDDGASMAEAIFHGAPGLDTAGARALAMAYLGGAPVTPEGAAYEWSDTGAFDPIRGTAHAPRVSAGPLPSWRPDPGLRGWLDALTHARLELSLDGEPLTGAGAPLQSAHVHLTARR